MTSSTATCICNLRDHIDFTKHHLEHTKQKEVYVQAQYSKVLDAFQKQYLEVSAEISREGEGGFEEEVLEGILDHLWDVMGNNEYCVEEAKRKLWVKFDAEEGIEVVGGGSKA